jgi:secretion/DNA translocation related TadE-like protein
MTDRGSGTVFALALSMLVVLAVTAGFVGGLAVVARHRAEAAADLAALAGAAAVPTGTVDACAQADRVARANGGRLDSCTVAGQVVEVQVAHDLRLGRLGAGTAVARVRAGPAATGGFGGRTP